MEIKNAYRAQVALLLNILPEIAKENDFALHGGTAINLFIRDMPRLSVDADLTYIPIEDRKTSFKNIVQALARIKSSVEKIIPEADISIQKKKLKLFVSTSKAQVKVEVSQANRGVIDEVQKSVLHTKVQNEFAAFCLINTVPFGQLYGGKICAALDRQHPRDLFDIKLLLENEGFDSNVKKGFLLLLLGSNRPLHELLNPHLKNQRQALKNQFEGMSSIPFSYKDFEETRSFLLKTIRKHLNKEDKTFLLSFINLTPDWTLYDFKKFPAIRWKLQNLSNLKEKDPSKHKSLIEKLESTLL